MPRRSDTDGDTTEPGTAPTRIAPPLSDKLRAADPRDHEAPLGSALARAQARERLFGVEPGSVKIGRFEVKRRLGEGGMGTVYLVADPNLDREVAVKLLHANSPDAEALQRRLLREAKAMAKLRHPNVITVFEVGEHDGEAFIAMEYVDGRTLRQWQEEERGWTEIMAIYQQAGDGLSAAHRAGLVHRDFKPDNVLIDADGRVQVTDFGIAVRGQLSEPAPTSLTATELASAGTPRYMAPEQHSDVGDARSDQFSFCVALFEALYDELPFEGDTREALLAASRRGPTAPERNPRNVPRYVAAALMRGMSPEPDERFASMADLLAALTTEPETTRWPFFVGVATIAIVGGWALTRAPPRPRLPAVPATTSAPVTTSAPTTTASARPVTSAPASVSAPLPAAPVPPGNRCTTTRACRVHGRCTPRGDTCIATSDARCKSSGACTQSGACSLRGEDCALTSTADCQLSSHCRRSARCTFAGGVCTIGSDADCARSEKCTSFNRCRRDPNTGFCVE